MWNWDAISDKRKKYFESFKNFLIFDIETVKDKKMFEAIADEREIERDQNGEFLSIPFHKVVALSYMVVKNGEIKAFKSISSKDEKLLLRAFWTAFIRSHTFVKTNSEDDENKCAIKHFPVLITVNGKDFDIPVIKVRTLKYMENFKENENLRKFVSIFLDKFDKWENEYPAYSNRYTLFHIDIPLDIFGKKISLKNMCYLCDIPVKTEGKGNEVEEYFNNGELEKIAKYCAEDVKATAKLFSYINLHFLFNSYPFPNFKMIDNF